ncbi:hypothetical protein UY3_07029 [Chelonia mydas]|uniref:Uncharacterized protein n=1 Tax=Chelonia mydas TaxID=8469 RepID=M7C5L2_CHEMY|nr:hypothetical protein UY3_07029 [Chelonia mydas]
MLEYDTVSRHQQHVILQHRDVKEGLDTMCLLLKSIPNTLLIIKRGIIATITECIDNEDERQQGPDFQKLRYAIVPVEKHVQFHI